jgi:hypothetical protein
MRLPFRHQHDAPAEVPCPRCKTPVPAEDLECNVCGWDLRDAYHPPEADATADLRVTAPREREEPPAA